MSNFVFIGDSVTDCDRIDIPPLGNGYVSIIAASNRLPGAITNVGTSGHRLIDLDARWDRDVLGNSPSYLSIAIGINDTWRRYDDNDPTSTEDFEERYRSVIERTLVKFTPRLALCEPFLLEVQPEMLTWREDLNPKIDVVHRLAEEYKAMLIPFDQMFHSALEEHSMEDLAGDGIHPTPLGHQMMADMWMEKMGF